MKNGQKHDSGAVLPGNWDWDWDWIGLDWYWDLGLVHSTLYLHQEQQG